MFEAKERFCEKNQRDVFEIINRLEMRFFRMKMSVGTMTVDRLRKFVEMTQKDLDWLSDIATDEWVGQSQEWCTVQEVFDEIAERR